MTNKPEEQKEENIEKYFDEENYETLVLNSAEENEKYTERISTLLNLLNAPQSELSRLEVLKLLKVQDGRELLMEAILSPRSKKARNLVVAACWESTLDFSNYFDFFVDLFLNEDFATAMEAFTVIEQLETNPTKEKLDIALEKLKAYRPKDESKQAMNEDLVVHLENRLEAY